MKKLAISAAVLLLSSCASYDGRGLVPGKSSARDVEALMGRPAETIAVAGGDSVLFFPRGPAGLETYAARISPQGTLVSLEQRLTVDNVRKLIPGVSTAKEARELLGPPYQATSMRFQQREAWQWRMDNGFQVDHTLVVQFSADGIVREVMLIRDPKYDQGVGRS